MPIISKETWDNLIPEDEKEKVREDYQNIIEAKRKISFTNDEISGAKYQMELLFGKENLQPQPLTYEDVARELFGGAFWYIDARNDVCQISSQSKIYVDTLYSNATLCTSRKQAEKLLAINRLLNVAKFLNKDWKPDWKDHSIPKYFIYLNENEIAIDWHGQSNNSIVYFRTEELAKQAIQILGEDIVRLALSSDF